MNSAAFDFLLFYLDGLHLVEKGNLKLGRSYSKEELQNTDRRVTNLCKNTVCSTDLNSNQEDFLSLPCIVPVRNSVYHLDKVIFKVFKVFSTSSVRPGKPISDGNVRPNKRVNAGSVRTGKPISNRNICLSKPVRGSSVSPGKPICGSNVCLSEHVSVIDVRPRKPISGSNSC